MSGTDFRSENRNFLNANGIEFVPFAYDGNKEVWTVRVQPYYQELIESHKSDWPGFEKIKNEIADNFERSNPQIIKEFLDQWENKVENTLDRKVVGLLDYICPVVIEEIPFFLKSANNIRKEALRSFYRKILIDAGLSPTFDPLAARIVNYFEEKPQKRKPKNRIANTGNQQLDHFLEAKETKPSINELKSHVLSFFKWIAGHKTGSEKNYKTLCCKNIDIDDIDAYRDHLLAKFNNGTLAAGTIRNKWTNLKQFFKYSNRMGWSSLSITINTIIPYSIKGREIKIYSDEELNLILDRFSKATTYPMRDFTLVCIYIDSGVRVNELLNLKFRDIYINDNKYIIRIGSKGKTRSILLSSPTAIIFANYLFTIDDQIEDDYVFSDIIGQKICYQTLLRKFCRLLGKDKDEGAFHRFRHTAITKAMESNIDPLDVIKKAGQSSLRVLGRYTHPKTKFLKQEAAKFPKLSEVITDDQ